MVVHAAAAIPKGIRGGGVFGEGAVHHDRTAPFVVDGASEHDGAVSGEGAVYHVRGAFRVINAASGSGIVSGERTGADGEIAGAFVPDSSAAVLGAVSKKGAVRQGRDGSVVEYAAPLAGGEIPREGAVPNLG